MRTILPFVLNLAAATFASATTTIDSVNKYTWGANVGWMDWRGDVASGADIGESFCSGWIYAANVGWISLGSGAPANGVRYQNNSAEDYGVNLDALGNLRGYAYGANIGWINFESIGAPMVDLVTGNFSGYAWSVNCGWISLSNAVAHVQTGTLLAVTRDDNTVLITWPLPPLHWDSDMGWILQFTTDLSTTVDWQDIAPPYGHVGGALYHFESLAPGNRFYRLHKP